MEVLSTHPDMPEPLGAMNHGSSGQPRPPTSRIETPNLQTPYVRDDTESSYTKNESNKRAKLTIKENLHTKTHGLFGEVPEEQVAILTPFVSKPLTLELRTVPVIRPSLGEVVVRIAWTGICASDIYFATGTDATYCSHSHIGGHEGIGHIVQSHDPAHIGQAVGMRFMAYTCGVCCYCLKGVPESCPRQVCFTRHLRGSYQQYATVPYTSLAILPDYVFQHENPAIYTTALCSGAAALKALRKAGIRPNDVVVVIGIGGQIGYLAGVMARRVYSARVVGIDIASKANSPTISEACDVYLPSPTEGGTHMSDEFQSLLQSTCTKLRADPNLPRGADAVIAAGSSVDSYRDLPSYVCDGGSIGFVGSPTYSITFDVKRILERQLSIKGTLMGDRKDSYQVMDYIRSGILKPKINEIELQDLPEYMQGFLAQKNWGKGVARINGPLPSAAPLTR
ncbi:hypothetical protein ANO14919_139600 [Xylariales sp. No.14919]|nr:hypothetical protein ANO14919_139600 [Xylariales sp. No.14919]